MSNFFVEQTCSCGEKDNDKRKNTFLSNKGWKVLRYWQSDILTSFDKVLDDINIYKTEFLCCQQKQKIV